MYCLDLVYLSYCKFEKGEVEGHFMWEQDTIISVVTDLPLREDLGFCFLYISNSTLSRLLKVE